MTSMKQDAANVKKLNSNHDAATAAEDKNRQLSVSEWDKNLMTTEGNQDYADSIKLPDASKLTMNGQRPSDPAKLAGVAHSQKSLQGAGGPFCNKFSNQVEMKNGQSESHQEEQLTVMEEEIVTNTDLNQSQQNMTAIQSVGMPMHSSSKKALTKEGETPIDGSKTSENNKLEKDMDLNTIPDQSLVRRNQDRQNTLTQMPNQKMNININELNGADSILQIQQSDKNLEFYPAQSERSRLVANQSQIQFLGLQQQPSETSTNNLLMYSQSIKMNDIESTIHNINNQSMMQSEFDPKMIDRLILEESEKLLKKKGDIDQDVEIMKKLKEMQVRPGGSIAGLGQGSAGNLTDEQMRAMLVMGQQNFQNLGNIISQGMMSGNLPDESINFSNLDSSINPSQYNEPQSNRNQKDRQHQKLQQQQILKAASLLESQQPNKKLKTNFSTQGEQKSSNKLSQEQQRQDKIEKKNRQMSPQKKKKAAESQSKSQPAEPNSADKEPQQKTPKIQVKDAIKAAQKLQNNKEVNIETGNQLNGAQVLQRLDSPSKAGRNPTGAKRQAQSPSQVQSKKVKLDRRQSNQEPAGAKENARDLLMQQPLLSDTEMTSFLTPTQTDNYENELSQVNKNKRLAESAATRNPVLPKSRQDHEPQDQIKPEGKAQEPQTKVQPQTQSNKQTTKKAPDQSPNVTKTSTDLFLAQHLQKSGKAPGHQNTPQVNKENTLNSHNPPSGQASSGAAPQLNQEGPGQAATVPAKSQNMGFHKYNQITKQNVEKKEQREKEKAERKASEMNGQMAGQAQNPANATGNDNKKAEETVQKIEGIPDPVASMSLVQYFERMNVNKNTTGPGLEVQTSDFKAPRVEISPIETANSAMMRYSRIIDSEDEQLFDHLENKEAKNGARRPPNTNLKLSKKTKKQLSMSPTKITHKMGELQKNINTEEEHEPAPEPKNDDHAQELLRFDDPGAAAAKARPNSQGNSRSLHHRQATNTHSQGPGGRDGTIITEQKIENIQNQYNQYNQIIVASGDLVLRNQGGIAPSQQRAQQDQRRPPGTAGQAHQNAAGLGSRGVQRKTPAAGGAAQPIIYPGSMIHHEDQSSYFNGLSGYEEFATKGGGPISDIQGYPQQNTSHIAGFHPVSMTHDGNNAGHKFAHQNAATVNLGNVGYLPFDQYDNDEDNFIQNDDGSQSANLMMLDGEYDHFLYNHPQNINRSIGSSMGHSSRAKLHAFPNDRKMDQQRSGNKIHSHPLQSFDHRLHDNNPIGIVHGYDHHGFPINSREFVVPNHREKSHYPYGQKHSYPMYGGWPLPLNNKDSMQQFQGSVLDKSHKNQVQPFKLNQSGRHSEALQLSHQYSAKKFLAEEPSLLNKNNRSLRASIGKALFPAGAHEQSQKYISFGPNQQGRDEGKQRSIVNASYNIMETEKGLQEHKLHSVHAASYVEKIRKTRELMARLQILRGRQGTRSSAKDREAEKKKVQQLMDRYTKDQVKRLNKLEKLKRRLPLPVILRIVQHLQTLDTFKLMSVNRYVRHTIMYQPEFEGQWVIKSFQSLLSKSGFSGIRNNNLRKIDIQMRPMHFQCQSLVKDAIEDQWHLLGVWWHAAFMLVFFVTPILLVVNEEQDYGWSMALIMSPTSVAWLLLILTMFCINQKISTYHKKVNALHYSQANYKSSAAFTKMGTPKGRITAHCNTYGIHFFKNRMLSHIAYSCIFCYLGVILKVYVFDLLSVHGILTESVFKMDWTMTLMVCYAPLLFLYCKEILGEGAASQKNVKSSKDLLMRFAHQSVNKNAKHRDLNELPTPTALQKQEFEKAENVYRNHRRKTCLLDFVGIFLNLLFIPAGVLAFLFLLAQRLDGRNQISYFLLIIPLWIISLPIFAYIILNGLAAQNTRINNCEKVTLSLLIPLGFLITLILLMWYAESDRRAKGEKLLKIVFVPHLLGLMSLYLYLRCLVRQVKKVHQQPEPAVQGQQAAV